MEMNAVVKMDNDSIVSLEMWGVPKTPRQLGPITITTRVHHRENGPFVLGNGPDLRAKKL